MIAIDVYEAYKRLHITDIGISDDLVIAHFVSLVRGSIDLDLI
jgi:hypothetical protein